MHYLYSLYIPATLNLCVFWSIFFFHPTSTPLFCFSGGQWSELDVRVECAQLINASVALNVLEAVAELGLRSWWSGLCKNVFSIPLRYRRLMWSQSWVCYHLYIEQNKPHLWQSVLQLNLLYSCILRKEGMCPYA